LNIPKTKKATDWRGERGYTAFLEKLCSLKSLIRNDLLLTDNEKSFQTDNVLDFLKSKGIIKGFYPPSFGHLMDPCDNSFHASMKMRYWHLVDAETPPINIVRRIELLHKAYYSEKEESIVKYFEKCGILGNEEPEIVINRLINEGLYPRKRFKNLHKHQLETYVDWKWGGKKTTKDVLGTRFKYCFRQK